MDNEETYISAPDLVHMDHSTVQLVFQATNILFTENHLMYLHGYSFYLVRKVFGNNNSRIYPLKFNIVNIPMRNTIKVPVSGLVVIKFKVGNPGNEHIS